MILSKFSIAWSKWLLHKTSFSNSNAHSEINNHWSCKKRFCCCISNWLNISDGPVHSSPQIQCVLGLYMLLPALDYQSISLSLSVANEWSEATLLMLHLSFLKSPSILSKLFQMQWTAISLLLTFFEISFSRIFLFVTFHHYGIPPICMSKTAMTLSWIMLSFFFFQLGSFKHVCKLNNLTRSRSFSAVISPNRIRRKRSGSRCVLTLSQKCPRLIILFGF